MYHFHPMIVHFSIVLFVLAMVYEALALITGKRLWPILAKIYIVAAALTAFITVISGLIDFEITWMTDSGHRFMNIHKILGITVFIIIILLANYRYLFQKMLPAGMFKIYLAMGALCLGLMFGTAYIGGAGVFYHGTGVQKAMINYTDAEEYLKRLYRLDEFPPPTAEDSLYALPFKPLAESLYTQIDTSGQSPQTGRQQTVILEIVPPVRSKPNHHK